MLNDLSKITSKSESHEIHHQFIFGTFPVLTDPTKLMVSQTQASKIESHFHAKMKYQSKVWLDKLTMKLNCHFKNSCLCIRDSQNMCQSLTCDLDCENSENAYPHLLPATLHLTITSIFVAKAQLVELRKRQQSYHSFSSLHQFDFMCFKEKNTWFSKFCTLNSLQYITNL